MNRGWVWDLLSLVTLALFLLNASVEGGVPLWFVSAALMVFVVLKAAGRGTGGTFGRAVRRTFAVGLPVAAALMFSMSRSAGDSRGSVLILTGVLTLIIVLVGLYIMVRAVFRR